MLFKRQAKGVFERIKMFVAISQSIESAPERVCVCFRTRV